MRQVILDTETTGLDPALGHRIIEIAGIEIVNRRLTNRQFHHYVNPERDSDEAALQVHGLTREFLRDKPRFAEIARDFLEFVTGAELVIHNAAFDLAFVNNELSLLKMEPVDACCASVVDTLKVARENHPGKRTSLNVLCERYGVDRSARKLHGALLDAQLLAEVYLAMTRGQESLIIEEERLHIAIAPTPVARGQWSFAVIRATPEELALHEQHLDDIGATNPRGNLWRASAIQREVAAVP